MNNPILFLIYNRPKETAISFEQIRINQPSELFIAADGADISKPQDEIRCRAVREIVANIDWPCQVKYLLRDEHLGAREGVSNAIKWFFEHVNEGIIIEDDCVVCPDFFTFCGQMLEKYRNHNKVMSIGGFNFGFQSETENSYGFSRYMNMWGWATWKREAIQIDYEMNSWLGRTQLNKYLLIQSHCQSFDVMWQLYWLQTFNKVAAYQNFDCWDYQWVYHQFREKKISIFPHQNLVKNIGFNQFATHTINSEHIIANTELQKLIEPIFHPTQIIPDTKYEDICIKKRWCNFSSLAYFKQFIFSLVSKNNV